MCLCAFIRIFIHANRSLWDQRMYSLMQINMLNRQRNGRTKIIIRNNVEDRFGYSVFEQQHHMYIHVRVLYIVMCVCCMQIHIVIVALHRITQNISIPSAFFFLFFFQYLSISGNRRCSSGFETLHKSLCCIRS